MITDNLNKLCNLSKQATSFTYTLISFYLSFCHQWLWHDPGQSLWCWVYIMSARSACDWCANTVKMLRNFDYIMNSWSVWHRSQSLSLSSSSQKNESQSKLHTHTNGKEVNQTTLLILERKVNSLPSYALHHKQLRNVHICDKLILWKTNGIRYKTIPISTNNNLKWSFTQ